MQPSSRTYENGRADFTAPGTGAADDYIDQLVQKIVDAAGVSAAPAAIGANAAIDLIQAHLEHLRSDGIVDFDAPRAATAGPSGAAADARVVRNRLPDVRSQPSPATPLRRVIDAGGPTAKLERSDLETAVTRPAQPSRHPNDVILKAMEGGRPESRATGDIIRRRRQTLARQGRRGGTTRLILLATILLVIGGCAVMVGQMLFDDVHALLQDYWIEEAPAPVALEQSAAPTATNGQVAEPARGDLTSPRRMVKTYRVGADGMIVTVPRTGP
jgi:hypothetical protein